MATCEVVDTFPAYMAYWEKVQDKPIDAQIETWAADYMSQWPELLEKQLDDYAAENEDWRQVARERVFPFLGDRLPAMKAARENLRKVCASTYSAARKALGFESDIVFVIYVGIGLGAGWATRFQNSPAVLFGLENVAECGWSQSQTLTGLIAHEIGHLVHAHWRAQHGQAEGDGPWWQLYCEGFAQRCEHVVLGRDSWHMMGEEYGEDWLDWCQEQKGWLAAEFLRVVDAGKSIRPFFGSWFEIRGRKQCGYFLGHELVKQLEKSMSLKEIALLDSQDARLRRELEELIGGTVTR
jgi:hypothetical protein